jgi:uncharacterized glyoxalase superfamily protein PhnB
MVTAMPERTSDPQVIPYLTYADAGAAMDWLIGTFAFTGQCATSAATESSDTENCCSTMAA